MADKPTREQALAFIEALAQSPAAKAHLEAVLGFDEVLDGYEASRACEYPLVNDQLTRELTCDFRARLDRLLDYLEGVVDALRPEGYGTCTTCLHHQRPDLVNCPAMASIGFLLEFEGLPKTWGCTMWTPEGGEAR